MPPPSSESVKALDVEAERSRRNWRPRFYFSFFRWSCQSGPGYKKSPPRLDTSLVGPLLQGGRGRRDQEMEVLCAWLEQSQSKDCVQTLDRKKQVRKRDWKRDGRNIWLWFCCDSTSSTSVGAAGQVANWSPNTCSHSGADGDFSHDWPCEQTGSFYTHAAEQTAPPPGWVTLPLRHRSRGDGGPFCWGGSMAPHEALLTGRQAAREVQSGVGNVWPFDLCLDRK